MHSKSLRGKDDHNRYPGQSGSSFAHQQLSGSRQQLAQSQLQLQLLQQAAYSNDPAILANLPKGHQQHHQGHHAKYNHSSTLNHHHLHQHQLQQSHVHQRQVHTAHRVPVVSHGPGGQHQPPLPPLPGQAVSNQGSKPVTEIDDLIHLAGPLTEDAILRTLQARFMERHYFVSDK